MAMAQALRRASASAGLSARYMQAAQQSKRLISCAARGTAVAASSSWDKGSVAQGVLGCSRQPLLRCTSSGSDGGLLRVLKSEIEYESEQEKAQMGGAILRKRAAVPFSLKGSHYDSTSPISEMSHWNSPQEYHKATLQAAVFSQASFHPSRNCTKLFVQHVASTPELYMGANSALESELEMPIVETVRPQVLKTKKLTKTAKHIMEILDREAVETVRKDREIPDVQPGDIVQLRVEVPENKRRVSLLKGIVIARRNSGINTTFRIRRVLAGVGVEMVFPLYSPNIKEIKVLEKRKVRRAKLFYLRQKIARMSSF